jgi:hypothetical protein
MTGQSTSSEPQEMAVEKTQQRVEGDREIDDATKKEQIADDNAEESSSTGSDGGKGAGSGSGDGYSTDYSSSDWSSLEAAMGNAPEKEMTLLNLNGDTSKEKATKAKATKAASSLPQWNGVRIHRPMDPRIDLSTVGHIQTSSLSAFPSNVDIPTNQHAEQQAHEADNTGESFEPLPPPSIDQYMKLMEVIL